MTDKRPEEAMERVLTDGEVEAVWQAWKHKHHVELIRGAEAAVLERMTKLGYRMHIPIAPAYGFVTEAEARERERWAYLRAPCSTVEEADRLYPLPHPKTPRTVTLSDGTRVTAQGGGSLFTVDPADKGHSTCWSPEGTPMIYKFARTPEDAEALADLVRHPFEVW